MPGSLLCCRQSTIPWGVSWKSTIASAGVVKSQTLRCGLLPPRYLKRSLQGRHRPLAADTGRSARPTPAATAGSRPPLRSFTAVNRPVISARRRRSPALPWRRNRRARTRRRGRPPPPGRRVQHQGRQHGGGRDAVDQGHRPSVRSTGLSSAAQSGRSRLPVRTSPPRLPWSTRSPQGRGGVIHGGRLDKQVDDQPDERVPGQPRAPPPSALAGGIPPPTGP